MLVGLDKRYYIIESMRTSIAEAQLFFSDTHNNMMYACMCECIASEATNNTSHTSNLWQWRAVYYDGASNNRMCTPNKTQSIYTLRMSKNGLLVVIEFCRLLQCDFHSMQFKRTRFVDCEFYWDLCIVPLAYTFDFISNIWSAYVQLK